MSEIKVGEYVRTDTGFIDKLNQYWLFNEKYKKLNIVKHSPNIIDLIEYGDVLEIFVNDNDIQKIVVYGDELYSLKIGELIAEDIKSIVTKEMMESVEYRID